MELHNKTALVRLVRYIELRSNAAYIYSDPTSFDDIFNNAEANRRAAAVARRLIRALTIKQQYVDILCVPADKSEEMFGELSCFIQSQGKARVVSFAGGGAVLYLAIIENERSMMAFRVRFGEFSVGLA